MNIFCARGLATLMLSLAVSVAARADVYDDLRATWSDMKTGGNYTIDPTIQTQIDQADAAVAVHRSTIQPAGSPQPYLFSNLPNVAWGTGLNTGHISNTYLRLSLMARALRTKGSDYEFIGAGSAAAQDIRDTVKRGLQWMSDNSYKSNADKVDPNWWDLEIGAPHNLGNALIFLSTGPFFGGANGGLTQAEIDEYTKPMYLKQRSTTLNYSGTNAVWKCRTWTLLGILRRNRDMTGGARDFLQEARVELDGPVASDVTLVTTWDSEGFRVDSSFYGHIAHPYTGGYGQSFLGEYLQLQEFFTGTSWSLNGSATASLVDWLVNGCDLSAFRWQYFQVTLGRGLTGYNTNGLNALPTAYAAIRLANVATPADAAKLRSLVKEWLSSRSGIDLRTAAGAEIPNYLAAKVYYDNYDASTTARPVLDFYKHFTETSYSVVQRPAYAAGVSMFTKDTVGNTRPQIKTNETSNGDTPQGAFLSNGALQLLTYDFLQYSNGYYENIDWQRLPGTTVDSDILPSGERYENASNFAGGVVLGRYGVSGFELQPKAGASETALGKFHARKAWFFFDKEIVALGSDIRRTDTTVDHKIHTNVENWRINPANDNVFKVDSNTNPGVLVTQPTTLSSSVTYKNGATRAWLQGNVPGTDTGYIFPASGGANLTLRRDHRFSTDPKAIVADAKFLTLWISHGIPSNGSYQYILLPNHTEAQTNTYGNSPEIAVLENSADAQAVTKSALGLTGALFLKNQNKTVQMSGANFLASDKIAAALVEETADKITIAASDPTWENTGQLVIELFRKNSSWESKSTGITVLQTTPTIKMQVDVNASRGKTFTLTLLKKCEVEKFATPQESSGDPYIVYPDEPGASGGGIISYNGTAVNDYVTFKLWHQMPGTYSLKVRFKRASNRARVGLSIGTDTVTMTPVGSQSIELYNATSDFVDVTVANVTFSAAGDRFLKFTATGKHASSGGYRIAIDSIELVPQ
jgi:hyaluronate lyase